MCYAAAMSLNQKRLSQGALLLVLASNLAAADLSEATSWLKTQGGAISIDRTSQTASISLRHSWVTDGDLARLASIPTIRRLDLSYTHVTDNGLEHLKGLAGCR